MSVYPRRVLRERLRMDCKVLRMIEDSHPEELNEILESLKELVHSHLEEFEELLEPPIDHGAYQADSDETGEG